MKFFGSRPPSIRAVRPSCFFSGRLVPPPPQRRHLFFWGVDKTAITTQVVPNSGSIARDVLAAERTFLAWSRTGLGFVGAGSALFAAYHRYELFEAGGPADHRPFADDTSTADRFYIYPAAALLVGNGAGLLVFATRRYLRTVSLLRQDQFLVDTRGTLLAVLGTALSTLTSLGLVVQAQQRPQGKETSSQEQLKKNGESCREASAPPRK